MKQRVMCVRPDLAFQALDLARQRRAILFRRHPGTMPRLPDGLACARPAAQANEGPADCHPHLLALPHCCCGCSSTSALRFFGGPALGAKVCISHRAPPGKTTELFRSMWSDDPVSNSSELVELKPWQAPEKRA